MRDLFLLDPDTVFLNHGSYGACPAEVLAELQRWQREMERNPVAFLGRRSGELLAQARAQWAAALGARGEDLVFVPNATTGVNTVAQSLPLQPGDEVLAGDHEYGACDAAWHQACAARGARYRRVEVPLPFEPERWVQRILDAVTPATKVIFASHISSTTALIFPVAELCAAARERGLLTVIDGAHAPGHVELDLATVGADFYTGNGHKWLCAPKGAAFLHVRPEHQALLQAPVVSWGYVAEASGHTGFDAYTGHTTLERRLQWQGTRDIAAWLSVPAALAFQQRHDWPALRQRCHELACQTQQRVLARNGMAAVAPDSAYGQMVTIPVRTGGTLSDAEALRRWLCDERRIEVPVTLHGDQVFVRISVQAYNTPADLDALVRALAERGA
jgi:isopenicillin-N epimerase